MRIATWNINSVNARLEPLQEWLEKGQFDIVLLQEIKTSTETFPYQTVEDLGYNIAVYGQKSYNGVAILSKFPLEDVTLGLPGFEDGSARYIEAFTGSVRVASIYVPNGEDLTSAKFQLKLNFMECLYHHIKTLLDLEESFVLGGDYNIAPYDKDIPPDFVGMNRLLFSQQEREALRRITGLGIIDALDILYPSASVYTWWDYRQGSFERDKGLRIDHLLLSPQAADRLREAQVDRWVRGLKRPSDHAPVWCRLEI